MTDREIMERDIIDLSRCAGWVASEMIALGFTPEEEREIRDVIRKLETALERRDAA